MNLSIDLAESKSVFAFAPSEPKAKLEKRECKPLRRPPLAAEEGLYLSLLMQEPPPLTFLHSCILPTLPHPHPLLCVGGWMLARRGNSYEKGSCNDA